MTEPRPRTIGELLEWSHRHPLNIRPDVLRALRRGRRWYENPEREKALDRPAVEAEWHDNPEEAS